MATRTMNPFYQAVYNLSQAPDPVQDQALAVIRAERPDLLLAIQDATAKLMESTAINGLGDLGFFKKIGEFFKKVGKEVKRGVQKFGSVLGPAVSLIPGVGPIVGGVITAASVASQSGSQPVYAADGMGPPLPPGWALGPDGVSRPIIAQPPPPQFPPSPAMATFGGIEPKWLLLGLGGLLVISMMRNK